MYVVIHMELHVVRANIEGEGRGRGLIYVDPLHMYFVVKRCGFLGFLSSPAL